MIFSKFFNWIFNRSAEPPPFPEKFMIIDYSSIALENNILNDQNKIIYLYSFNFLTNDYNIKKYRYSEERLSAMIETYRIPFYDKTRQKQRFPIFSRVLPSEVEASG